MTLSVRRLAESFVGEVSGIDLARLDDAATAAVKEAWLAHKVLVFHDQHLDEDGLVAFAEQLGDVDVHLRQTRTSGRRDPFPDEYPRLLRRVGFNFPADLSVPF